MSHSESKKLFQRILVLIVIRIIMIDIEVKEFQRELKKKSYTQTLK